jgi:transposase
MMVARVWRKHGLKPHRIARYLAANDPGFESQAADIVGLYLNPPAHAAVFCVNDQPHIQALARSDPLRSLYATFNTRTGDVLGKPAKQHTTAEFVAFLTDIVIGQPSGNEIHVLADNLTTYRSRQIKDFLAAHPRVRWHFAPTYSSWLKQIGLWLEQIEHVVVARGVCTSGSDLNGQLLKYIRHYNKAPRTVKWKYGDAAGHIGAQPVGAGN